MAILWSNVIRQVLLRGNFFAGNQAALAALYSTATFTDAHLTDSGAEYPFAGVCDGILQAMGMIVGAIGANRESQYRQWFAKDTAVLVNRASIPTAAFDGTPRYGAISDVRDGTDNIPLTFQPRAQVEIELKSHSRFKVQVYHYFADDNEIWHTRTNVKAKCVAWDRAAELPKLVANNANNCPLPEDLIPVLEKGSLSFIFRDTFNAEQAQIHWQQFVPEVNKIAGKTFAMIDQNPKV